MNLSHIYKFLFFYLTIILIVSCSDKTKFTIRGDVQHASGKTVYLEHVGIAKASVLDSVRLKGNGKFSFKQLRPESPDFYRLKLDNQLINFSVDSTETIVIHADISDFSQGYTVEGSDNCLQIKKLTLLQMRTKEDYSKLQKQFNEKQIPQEEYQKVQHDILKNYKDSAQVYIFSDPKSPVSYFALFQQIDGLLIFNPYDVQDNKLYRAVATSLNLFYPDAIRTKHLNELTLNSIKVLNSQRHVPREINVEEKDVVSYFEIVLSDLSGTERKLSDLVKTEKVILVDFTAYQTEYSSRHNMDLDEVYEKYKNKGLEIFQVSLDTDLHFWKNVAVNLPWICVRDPQSVYSQVAATYFVKNLPTAFIINKKGEIVKRIENYKNLESEIKSFF